MKNINSFLCFLIIGTALFCQKQSSAKTEEHRNKCPQKFSEALSESTFTGRIILWEEPSALVDYRGLWLTDSEGDTIIFRIEEGKTANVEEGNIKENECITIIYETDIVKIKGIEVNRFYYAKRLVYP